MSRQRDLIAVRYVVVTLELVAMAFCVLAFVLGVELAIDSTVLGGCAVMIIAAIVLAVVGWRVQFRWHQLRGHSS